MLSRKRFSSLGMALIFLWAGHLGVQAQTAANYPNKAITMIVPFPPGGPTDTYARLVAGKMQQNWGQPVLVENKPGAGAMLAIDQVLADPTSISLR